MTIKHLSIIVALLVAGASSAQAQTGTISFRQGQANAFSGEGVYSGVQDATLNKNAPSSNYGAANGVSFSSGQYAGLIRFDMGSFPDTVSAVQNATLRIGIPGRAEIADTNFQILVYQLNANNAGWNAGSKTGQAATEGEAAWDFKAKGGASTANTPWAGAEGQQGWNPGEYSASTIATYNFVASASGTLYIDIELPGEVIANWINNPSSNAGLVFRSDSATPLSFHSSNYATVSIRPMLTFDYTLGPPIPEPATAALGAGIVACVAAAVMRRRKSRSA